MPDEANFTPVHVTGDFFYFDVDGWVVDVPNELRIPRDQDGYLVEEMDQRGPAAGVHAYRLKSLSHPNGCARGHGAVRPTSTEKRLGMASFLIKKGARTASERDEQEGLPVVEDRAPAGAR